jgi:hypothetical protein
VIHLALTILSAMFLTGLAATLLWCAYVAIGLVILGTRELCRYMWKEFKAGCVFHWNEFKKALKDFWGI